MDAYEPDLAKVKPNPFEFKTNREEADSSLREYLRIFAKFFETVNPKPGEIEAAWQTFQSAHGSDGVLRLAFSISHVSGTQADLDHVDQCEHDHELGRFGAFQVLLHLGLIELADNIRYMSQFDWALSRLKKHQLPALEVSFPWCAPWRRTVVPRDLRRFLGELKEAHAAERGSARALVRALSEGLPEGDRATLLNGWAFSDPYPLGTSYDGTTLMHLHCKARYTQLKSRVEERIRQAKSDEERQYYASIGGAPDGCWRYCKAAVGDEVTDLFPVLVKHLWAMRNQIVHAASPIILVRTRSKAVERWAKVDGRDVPVKMEGSVLDGYFVGDGKLITYRGTLSVGAVTSNLRRCLWNRIRSATQS